MRLTYYPHRILLIGLRLSRNGNILVVFVFAALLANFIFLLSPVLEKHKVRRVNFDLLKESTNSSVTSLLDLHSFRFRINADVCFGREVFILILVHSHQGNLKRREEWRKVLSRDHLDILRIRRVFLLAEPSDQPGYTSVDQWRIYDESMKYGDIIQGNFEESYHHLTYKHVMGLQWATLRCGHAAYVLKMDDDIAVDFYQLVQRLVDQYQPRALLLGLVHFSLGPERERDSKWFVSDQLIAEGRKYPPFLSGWMYVASMDAVQRILTAARALATRSAPFWIDDVFVTGMAAAEAGLQLSSLNSFFTPAWQHLECCSRVRAWRCDFIVGPVGQRPGLLAEFIDQARHCWHSQCPHQPSTVNASRKCIVTDDHSVGRLLRGSGSVQIVPI